MQVLTFRPAQNRAPDDGQDVKLISDTTKSSAGARCASLLNNLQFQKLTYITYTFLVNAVYFGQIYVWKDLCFDSVRLLSRWGVWSDRDNETSGTWNPDSPFGSNSRRGQKIAGPAHSSSNSNWRPLVLSPSDTGQLCGNLEQRNNAMCPSLFLTGSL
jgi:hypothetical protein